MHNDDALIIISILLPVFLFLLLFPSLLPILLFSLTLLLLLLLAYLDRFTFSVAICRVVRFSFSANRSNNIILLLSSCCFLRSVPPSFGVLTITRKSLPILPPVMSFL